MRGEREREERERGEGGKGRGREGDLIHRFIASFPLPSVDSSYLAPHMSNLMPGFEPAIDIDQQTDSNHDTALTLAAAGMIRTISSQYYDISKPCSQIICKDM